MPQPEGYRKAKRLMNLAEQFALPVITFVDTAGAYLELRVKREDKVRQLHKI